mmetsp:Transcript_74925/g.175833  ORF Transcript_74925/g.175833 Transcript_74925/m.175833 type:complete len:208 (+) Transcript_74925:34-657(+)
MDKLILLKLVEKGFKRDTLGILSLIEFPFQIIFAMITGRWASGDAPLAPWIRTYWCKLLLAPVGIVIVWMYSPDTYGFGAMVLGFMLLVAFANNVMFTAMGSFFARIGDPAIGGSYLTLLNTISNLGGTWPQSVVLFAVEPLTFTHCPEGQGPEKCEVIVDGFYVTNFICLGLGAGIGWFILSSRVALIQKLAPADWRAFKRADDEV